MITPFQAKTNFLTLKFFYPAALGAQKTARTASPSLGDVNVEGLDPEGTAQAGTIGTRLGWSKPRDGRPATIQDGFCMQGLRSNAKWSTLNVEIPKGEA